MAAVMAGIISDLIGSLANNANANHYHLWIIPKFSHIESKSAQPMLKAPEDPMNVTSTSALYL